MASALTFQLPPPPLCPTHEVGVAFDGPTAATATSVSCPFAHAVVRARAQRLVVHATEAVLGVEQVDVADARIGRAREDEAAVKVERADAPRLLGERAQELARLGRPKTDCPIARGRDDDSVADADGVDRTPVTRQDESLLERDRIKRLDQPVCRSGEQSSQRLA